jgi:SAM-dependent methyltransferase
MTESGESIAREEGRELFGLDPAGYDRARPPYPGELYDLLVRTCGLGPGVATLEIGAGTGTATRRLAALGARPLVTVEPDPRLAAYLTAQRLPISVVEAPFERAALPRGRFALAVCATAFHWIETQRGLARVAECLVPGGWWAVWWNVFGDPDRKDPFHQATRALLRQLPMSNSGGAEQIPYALDRVGRLGDLERSGAFEPGSAFELRWTLGLDPAQTRALYATYSSIARLERTERDRLLDEIARIARTEFAGRVERHMVTAGYLARGSA